MAPFATLHTITHVKHPPSTKILAAANINGLELALPPSFEMGVTNKSPEYLKKFPLGKIPALETPSGFLLTESSAIAYYVSTSGPKSEQLLGRSPEESAKIRQWISFADTEVQPVVSPLILPLIGWAAYDEKLAKEKDELLHSKLAYVEAHLQDRELLVNNVVSLADLSMAGALFTAFRFYIDRPMREKFPAVTAWYVRVTGIKEVEDAFGKVEFLETRPEPKK